MKRKQILMSILTVIMLIASAFITEAQTKKNGKSQTKNGVTMTITFNIDSITPFIEYPLAIEEEKTKVRSIESKEALITYMEYFRNLTEKDFPADNIVENYMEMEAKRPVIYEDSVVKTKTGGILLDWEDIYGKRVFTEIATSSNTLWKKIQGGGKWTDNFAKYGPDYLLSIYKWLNHDDNIKYDEIKYAASRASFYTIYYIIMRRLFRDEDGENTVIVKFKKQLYEPKEYELMAILIAAKTGWIQKIPQSSDENVVTFGTYRIASSELYDYKYIDADISIDDGENIIDEELAQAAYTVLSNKWLFTKDLRKKDFLKAFNPATIQWIHLL